MEYLPQAITSNPSFTPLFRLLDDFEKYSHHLGGGNERHHHRSRLPPFCPKFDLRELTDAFELDGELAGVQRKDMTIEFTDAQTMVIRGSVERSCTSGTLSAALEGNTLMTPAIAAAPVDKGARSPARSENETASTNGATALAPPATDADGIKYMLSERSIGEFLRSFTFPEDVHQDGVIAKLEDGILCIRVPKAKKQERRRVAIA